MNYATVSSGISAETAAWKPLGWKPEFFSEIDPFASAVLRHHYPTVPNYGDMNIVYRYARNIRKHHDTIDLLAGGTPCQSFSVAGLRKGMDDPRGNLALVFLGIAYRFRPRWIIWENVPGVLSSNKGRDFGAFLGALAQLGYGFSYRVLDAQHFGVPQRRRRVFLVAHSSGDERIPFAVLNQQPGHRGDIAPIQTAQKAAAGGHDSGAHTTVPTVTSQWAKGSAGPSGDECQNLVTGTLCAGGKSAGSVKAQDVENGMLIIGFNAKSSASQSCNPGDIMPTLDVAKRGGHTILEESYVRRLTPIECERLQGFPDDFTRIPYRGRSAENCPDGPRYKVIGNSQAVPVQRWIGERIMIMEQVLKEIKL